MPRQTKLNFLYVMQLLIPYKMVKKYWKNKFTLGMILGSHWRHPGKQSYRKDPGYFSESLIDENFSSRRN